LLISTLVGYVLPDPHVGRLNTEERSPISIPQKAELAAFSLVCFGGDEMAIEKLKRHKPTDIDQIPAELIKAGGRTIRYEIH
jgi:hypothetical protein